MTARTRLISAALVVVFAAAGASLYAERAAGAAAPTLTAGEGIPGLGLTPFLGGGTSGGAMIAIAYQRLETAYYKPVSDQLLLHGEREALTRYLAQIKNVRHPAVPAPKLAGSAGGDLRALQTTLASVEHRYPHAATREFYTEVALAGMLNGLGDPYTTYLSPAEIRQLDEELRGGNFGGIGVYIALDPKTKQIVADPIEGNPAIRAGVRTGDIIVAVDGKPTAGQSLDTVEKEIRGPRGTVVRLGLKRRTGARVTVAVTRGDVHVPSVRAKIENGIDYVRLSDFGSTSATEVRDALLEGKRHGVRGYILDLRNNGGGLLDAAVDISSLFIDKGPIVSTIDRAGDKDTRDAIGDAIGATPLVVLVNKYTASASEITAGAIQDDRVGTLVGEKTFGKGVVQSLYTMPDDGALKITTARYVTPKGRDIQHRGIVPDVVVPQSVDLPIIDTPADKQLAVAKSLIDKKAAP